MPVCYTPGLSVCCMFRNLLQYGSVLKDGTVTPFKLKLLVLFHGHTSPVPNISELVQTVPAKSSNAFFLV
jgi:hypothetical protein